MPPTNPTSSSSQPAHDAGRTIGRAELGKALLITLLFALAFVILFVELRNAENELIERTVSERAESVNERIVGNVLDQIQTLSRIANHWGRHELAEKREWSSFVAEYLAQYDYYRSIAWIDRDLNVRWLYAQGPVHEIEGAPLNLTNAAMAELELIRNQKMFRITEPFWLPDGEPGITLHFPMHGEDGEVQLLSATMAVRETIRHIIGPADKRDYWLFAYAGDSRLYPNTTDLSEHDQRWAEEFFVNVDNDQGGIRIVAGLQPDAVVTLRSGLPFIVLAFGAGLAIALGLISLLALRSRRQTTIVRRANAELQTEVLERELAEQELQHLATHDPLTGLPNRAGFQRQLEKLLADSTIAHDQLCLMFVDLDRFKDINDSLGHAIGDRLLQQVPDRLRSFTGELDLLGRYGGDEFILALVGREERAQVTEVAEQILRSFDDVFRLDDNQLYVSASVGLAFCPRHNVSASNLIRYADSALNKAKQAGRNRYAVFSEDILAEATDRMAISRDIRLGLQRDEFRVVYQPIVRLSDFRIIGVEALLRWQRTDGQQFAPEQFIPIAEDSGSIVPLGRFVIRQTLGQMNKLRKAQKNPVWVAINVSAVQFRDPKFPEFLSVEMHRNRMPPENIHLEITEKVLIENVRENRVVLDALQDLGLRISVDDFGIGYSSLAYLKHLTVHCLKIDQSFVRDLAHDSDDRAIARTICSLARNLGIETVSEGVESQQQVDYLREFGCDQAQGYLFSVPLEAEQLMDLMANTQNLEPGNAMAAKPSASVSRIKERSGGSSGSQ